MPCETRTLQDNAERHTDKTKEASLLQTLGSHLVLIRHIRGRGRIFVDAHERSRVCQLVDVHTDDALNDIEHSKRMLFGIQLKTAKRNAVSDSRGMGREWQRCSRRNHRADHRQGRGLRFNVIDTKQTRHQDMHDRSCPKRRGDGKILHPIHCTATEKHHGRDARRMGHCMRWCLHVITHPFAKILLINTGATRRASTVKQNIENIVPTLIRVACHVRAFDGNFAMSGYLFEKLQQKHTGSRARDEKKLNRVKISQTRQIMVCPVQTRD